MIVSIKKIDDELQVVYGEVYAPNLPDAQGHFMSPVEVVKMAHNFLRRGNLGAIDQNHDNKVNGSVVVESFIVDTDTSPYILGAWVVGVHVVNPEIWALVKSGELNGFSMEALVQSVSRNIELEVPDVIQGQTLADESGHTHEYSVRFDEQGNFLGGSTSIVNGHTHNISKSTVTDEADGHTHKFSILEAVEEFEVD